MPPKGWKAPPAPTSHCGECGLLLPAERMRMIVPALVELGMSLQMETGADLDAEAPRARVDRVLQLRTVQVSVARARVMALIDTISIATCAGHDKPRAKPGPKPGARAEAEPGPDPSFPNDPDTPKPRRRRLRAVTEETAHEDA